METVQLTVTVERVVAQGYFQWQERQTSGVDGHQAVVRQVDVDGTETCEGFSADEADQIAR